MGIERDFLMRQLMMLFEVIRKILRLRTDGNKEEALEQIRFFYETLKIEENLDALSIEEMIGFLANRKKLTLEQLELVAFVLKEQGEMAENESNKEDYFRKAWFLLDKVERESITFSMERLMKLEELRGRLN